MTSFISFPQYESKGEYTRTKEMYPYSYDPIVQYKVEGTPNFTLHSDRLFQEDSDKFNILSKKHFGNYSQEFFRRYPNAIQNFLREFTNREHLKVVKILECCNFANGFPYWAFHCEV